METIAKPPSNRQSWYKQLDPAHNLVPLVDAPHIRSRIFFFGKEKRKLFVVQEHPERAAFWGSPTVYK